MKNKKIRFLNLSVTNLKEKKIIIKSISEVLDHGIMVMGPEISRFEKKVAKFCNRKYAVSVGSGTDALILAIKSLNLEPGDEVITTSLSWIATANAISINNLIPVFADINNDLNISPNSIKSLITKKTKAVLVVNYTGKIAEMDTISNLCTKNKLYLIEDGSQSFGAKYKNKINGSFGVISAISHNPMKVFSAIGEAGTVLTNNKLIKDRLESLRYNGTINKETCIYSSSNSRMDTIQASILLNKFKTIDSIIAKRKINALYYLKHLKDIVDLPCEKNYQNDIYYTFTIKAKKRNSLAKYLFLHGIETKIQHPLLMSQQPYYKKNVKGNFPNAKKIIKKVLCLPIHEKLKTNDLAYVVKYIKKFYDK
ncbi:DegT/DnrJ/EryC1/StrS family aminotransferase [Alphaproteobacteria bacterium]|nr:DegT/DnrJ/EryC1/StrS family aminotransferase [Alphaproteobacteria bacterium]